MKVKIICMFVIFFANLISNEKFQRFGDLVECRVCCVGLHLVERNMYFRCWIARGLIWATNRWGRDSRLRREDFKTPIRGSESIQWYCPEPNLITVDVLANNLWCDNLCSNFKKHRMPCQMWCHLGPIPSKHRHVRHIESLRCHISMLVVACKFWKSLWTSCLDSSACSMHHVGCKPESPQVSAWAAFRSQKMQFLHLCFDIIRSAVNDSLWISWKRIL